MGCGCSDETPKQVTNSPDSSEKQGPGVGTQILAGVAGGLVPIPYLNRVVGTAILNTDQPKPKRNKRASYWLELDKFETMASIRDYLGQGCFSDQTCVNIILLGRELHSAFALNYIHPAWLIIFRNHSTFEFATVEYGEKGVLLGIYKKDLQLSCYEVCTTIIGGSNKILANESFSTTKSWGDILEKIYKISGSYSAKSFDKLTNNCKDFAKEFGNYLIDKSINISWYGKNCTIYQ
jgi:hypothetical protein